MQPKTDRPRRKLNNSAVHDNGFRGESPRWSPIQGDTGTGHGRSMTATCRTCGEPCLCEQWFAGGSFACSLACLGAV